MAKQILMKESKPTIKFSYTDGQKVAVAPWGVNVRAPWDITIPPGTSVSLDFGVSCDDAALLCWLSPDLVGPVGLDEVAQIFDVGEGIALNLKNLTNGPMTIMKGQTVLRAGLFSSAGYDIL